MLHLPAISLISESLKYPLCPRMCAKLIIPTYCNDKIKCNYTKECEESILLYPTEGFIITVQLNKQLAANQERI
jgi:hypothetical protein